MRTCRIPSFSSLRVAWWWSINRLFSTRRSLLLLLPSPRLHLITSPVSIRATKKLQHIAAARRSLPQTLPSPRATTTLLRPRRHLLVIPPALRTRLASFPHYQSCQARCPVSLFVHHKPHSSGLGERSALVEAEDAASWSAVLAASRAIDGEGVRSVQESKHE